MNITFFIGNGFDLNLGLNSRYSEFYPYFISKATENNMIKGWISEDETKWSDMELALGGALDRIQSNEVVAFLRDKGELDSLLAQYLKSEENRVKGNIIEATSNEFVRSLLEFDKHLPRVSQSEIQRIKNAYRDESIIYNFVSFNYTFVLDRMVRHAKKKRRISEHRTSIGTMVGECIGSVTHVHGTTKEAMILGVDNIEQIGNRELRDNDILLQSFIKPTISRGDGRNVIEEVLGILENTHIICIYGMSLGDTDKSWWNALVRWLDYDNNCLVVFAHNDDPTTIIQSASMQRMKTMEVYKKLLSRDSLPQDGFDILKKKIFVVFEPSIFCFAGAKHENIRV